MGAFAAPVDTVGQGPGNQFHGGLYEILVYARVLAAAEIATVEAYLAAKWGLA